MTKVDKNVLTLSQGCIFFMTAGVVNYVPLTSHSFLNNYQFDADSL